jgi:hypothetical protein
MMDYKVLIFLLSNNHIKYKYNIVIILFILFVFYFSASLSSLYQIHSFLCYQCMDYGCYDDFDGLSESSLVPIEKVECNTTCFVRN